MFSGGIERDQGTKWANMSEAYSETCQSSKMELSAKISSIWYVWQGSEYAYAIDFQN